MKQNKWYEINGKLIWISLKRNILWLLAFALLGAFLGFQLMNALYVPYYESSAAVAVNVKKEGTSRYDLLPTANGMAQTFQKMIVSNITYALIWEEMPENSLPFWIAVTLPEDSNLLEITVNSQDPDTACQALASLMNRMQQMASMLFANAIWDEVRSPEFPEGSVNENGKQQGAVYGLFLGFSFAGFFLLMKNISGNSVKTRQQASSRIEADQMEVIPYERKRGKSFSSFWVLHAYQRLAVKVEYRMRQQDAKILLITSMQKKEGKSTVAVNLAKTLVRRGKKVLLVEGNFIHPQIGQLLELNPKKEEDFGNWLLENGRRRYTVLSSTNPRLSCLVACGTSVSMTQNDPKSCFEQMLQKERANRDYILIDGTAFAASADAEAMLDMADLSLLVLRQNTEKIEEINKTCHRMKKISGYFCGYIINGYQEFFWKKKR